MLRPAWIVLAAVFPVFVLGGEAPAQGGSGICTVANTCSEAFFQCITVNCPAAFDASCTASCRSRFNGCMRSGGFDSRDCRDKTLVQK